MHVHVIVFGPVEISGLAKSLHNSKLGFWFCRNFMACKWLAKSLLIVSRQFSPVEITGHAILLHNEDFKSH